MNVLRVPTTERVSNLTSGGNALSLLDLLPIHQKLSLKERVTLLLIRDLLRLGWRLKSNSNKSFEFSPPDSYEKNVVVSAMAYSRNEVIQNNIGWIGNHIELAHANLGSGSDVLKSDIHPRIEVCQTEKQKDIFRIFRYCWSSPASDYVGRRMRLLVRDDAIKGSPVIGIAAIGSSIIHIPARDEWIGWDIKTRTNRIINMMDAYVIGALPPYNYLLGGKLISYLLASDELRKLYKKKYVKAETILKKRKASDLVLIMTTSLYGHKSSQYNRLKFGKSLLYKPIGTTSGYGSLHISNETFAAMRELVGLNGYELSNKFGMGPNWRMRVIRSACDILGLNSEVILKHSFQRGLFAVPLATNYKSFLRGDSKKAIYRNLPLPKIVDYWRERWLNMRKQNDLIRKKVLSFSPEQFQIEQTIV
jgi:Domain of unknown function (DUF4338)